MPNTGPAILKGYSALPDAAMAARELRDQIYQQNAALAVVFCSPEYDRQRVEAALAEQFTDIPLVGCTTAGEITPDGYRDGTLVGFSLPASDFAAVSARIDKLADQTIATGHSVVKDLIAELDSKQPRSHANDTFAYVLIDGLSLREEALLSSVYGALEFIPLIGGSAGDDLTFGRTAIFHDGRFHGDCAVLTLVRTRHPFKIFKTQHFLSTEKKMVVTEADPQMRIVTEINGEPAGKEYARLIGLDEEALSPMCFATFPVVVKIGGREHVRSIQKVNEDGSLTFFCAIDVGVVLTVAQGVDILENLKQLLAEIRAEIGQPQLIVGCDCVLRKLELERKQVKQRAGSMLADHHTVGFSTYGEQFLAMHVNQTFTGVAIGRAQ